MSTAEATPTPAVVVRRSAERFQTRLDWLESRHSFSFGAHYDPDNTHFGLLLASNDDLVRPGTGYETHQHRDMEILTWVLSGSLMHQDSTGHSGLIYPGLAQRMSAGCGILHSETNDSNEPVRFVQMWVRPDQTDSPPGYEQRDITTELRRGGLVTVASGRPRDDAAIRIRQRAAVFHVGRLSPSQSVALPTAPFVHLYVPVGTAQVEGIGPLGSGDAARIGGAEGQRLTAGESGAEVLVWEMHASSR